VRTPDGVPAAGAAAVWGLAHRCALGYPESIRRAGIPNELTSSADRDWFAGTPHHEHVRARIEPIEQLAIAGD
jgi:hypothetical protein